MSKHTLNAEGMLCPMPVIKAQNKIIQLAAGDILEVSCTDPGVRNDIPAWCRINGHTVIDQAEENNIITITIQVGNDTS
ncbi:MAG: sulfurtransferase TusA family protein [Gammaproteobacteria bacterium]|nr:sulfurtransferase TusA family protein [Gammaproteobacteria bacterium]